MELLLCADCRGKTYPNFPDWKRERVREVWPRPARIALCLLTEDSPHPVSMILPGHLPCHDTGFLKNEPRWALLSVVVDTYCPNNDKINKYIQLHTVPPGLSSSSHVDVGEFLCLYTVPVFGVSKESSVSLKSTAFSKECHLTSPQGLPFLVHLCTLMVINTFYLTTLSSSLCALSVSLILKKAC